MKSIFDYFDYRDYLKDFYEYKKSENAYFSFRVFGGKIGMDASYLVKVVARNRHIAYTSIPVITDFCKLFGKEAEYFEGLVHFVKAKSHKESKIHFEKLLSLKSVSANKLVEVQFEFYQKWYHSAIRSCLEFFEFRGDYKSLAEQLSPKISIKEAKDSIQLLAKFNLIKKDHTGRYLMTDIAITTGREWHSLAIRAFQEETIRLSHESLTRYPKERRDVSTITMNINQQNFQEIQEMIREFRSAIVKHVNEQTGPDQVVQMNIQLFPLSKIAERGKQ